MKIRCIKNEKRVKKGIINCREEIRKIEGITVGKQYQAEVVSREVEGWEIRFSLFNDQSEWALYQPEYFKAIR